MAPRVRTWTRKKDGKEMKRWTVRFRYKHVDGHRELIRDTSPVNTRDGAIEHERQVRNALQAGTWKKGSARSKFSEVSAAFLDHKPSWKHGARKYYEQKISDHLDPEFGDQPIASVTEERIAAFTRKLQKDKHTDGGVNAILRALRAVLGYAKRKGYLRERPKVSLQPVVVLKPRYLERAELDRFLAEAKRSEPLAFPWLLLLAKSGLRVGEAGALRWGSVDLRHGHLEVREAVYDGVTSTPKSNQSRQVELPPSLVTALRKVKPKDVKPDVLVFPGLTSQIARYPIARICKRLEIEPFGVHRLRHTYCSALAAKNVPVTVIQALAGHSTLAVTQKYMHVAPSQRRAAVKVLD